MRLASRLEKPGPRTVPRPALPGRTAPCGTAAKQAVLNQVGCPVPVMPGARCGALALGSHNMSGRELEALLPSRPRPAGARVEVVTVKGEPVYMVRIPASSQPLST